MSRARPRRQYRKWALDRSKSSLLGQEYGRHRHNVLWSACQEPSLFYGAAPQEAGDTCLRGHASASPHRAAGPSHSHSASRRAANSVRAATARSCPDAQRRGTQPRRAASQGPPTIHPRRRRTRRRRWDRHLLQR
eukprot:scaffold377_cov563-Prasinococcus_capsulatus_cf.AAC.19